MNTKKGIIGGPVPKKSSKRTLVLVGVAVLVAIIVGLGLWYWLFRPEPLTPLQRSVKTTIPSQEKALHEDTEAGRPLEIQVLSLGNLAQSYAYVGECDKALAALERARDIVTEDLKSVLRRVERDVDGRC